MNISEVSDVSSILAITQLQEILLNRSTTAQEVDATTSTDTDSYEASALSMDAIPSMNYTAQGIMEGDTLAVAAASESSDSTDEDVMSMLQETFRANADSIEMAMESLGLTLDDLSDESNLTALASLMNEGAASLGVPQVENLSDAVSSLFERITGAAESDTSDEENQSGSTAVSGTSSSGSDSESEETTEIVFENGIPYLVTTTTTGGITTETRTPLSRAMAV